MAEKLSDSELAAIISITDKSTKLEKEVNALRNEKEALAAKLDGTEAVTRGGCGACQSGGGPAVGWVLLVLMGATHDFGALVLSDAVHVRFGR